MRTRRWHTRRLAALAAASALLIVAACSSDDSSSSDDTAAATAETSGGDTAGTAAAGGAAALEDSAATVEALLTEPTTVGVQEPLGEAAPTDVKVAWLECPIPDCAAFGRGVEAASDALGWDFSRVSYDLTPESAQAAFDQALAADANVIVTVGTDPSWLEEQRAAAAEKDVVFIDCCTLYEPDAATATGKFRVAENPPDAVINNVDFIQREGSVIADYAITQTDGQVNGLTVYVPDFPIGLVTAEAIDKRLAEVCPDTCKSSPLEVAVTDLGTNVGSMVVSELQRDPSINYLFFITGDFALGVSPALAEAGLADSVKVVGNSGNLTNFEEMAEGTVDQAWLGVPLEVEGWRMVDMAVRTLQGEIVPETSNPDDTGIGAWPTFQIVTKDNYPDPQPYVAPADYEQQFRELWLLN